MAGTNKNLDGTTEERLMALFQSRAELKQEFNKLEKDKLILSKIKSDQANRIEFLESDLKRLEKHLTKLTVYEDTKVYYQLRKLWTSCNRYIHKFRDRLVDQQRDRERKTQLMEFNLDRSKKLEKLNDEIAQAKKLLDGVVKRISELNKKIAKRKYPWHYFGKRGLVKQRSVAHKTQTEVYLETQTLYEKRNRVESEPWPEFDDLDLPSKRSVNLAMIAMAQYFYVSLTDMGLSYKAYNAQLKRPWELSYGDAKEQQRIIEQCEDKLLSFSKLQDLGTEIQSRMTFLQDQVAYKKESDSIPDPATITKLVNDISGTALSVTLADVSLEINVLSDNYWGLKDLMIP